MKRTRGHSTPRPLNKDNHFYCHQVKDPDSMQQPLAKEQ